MEFGQFVQAVNYFDGKLGICRISDVLFLYGGINIDVILTDMDVGNAGFAGAKTCPERPDRAGLCSSERSFQLRPCQCVFEPVPPTLVCSVY